MKKIKIINNYINANDILKLLFQEINYTLEGKERQIIIIDINTK